MDNKKQEKKSENNGIKDQAGVMVYGNLKIIDVNTGEILVNKRT
jgi:hypothetical protein